MVTTVGNFNNLVSDLPLNARINFVINEAVIYINTIVYSQYNNQITITTSTINNGNHQYLYSITHIIRNSNVNNNVGIVVVYHGGNYEIDIVDTSFLHDGIIRFHLVRISHPSVQNSRLLN